MLQLPTRRLIRVAITAASALALCAGSAAAAPKTDNGNGSSAHGSQKVDDHQPAGGGTGRRIG